MYWTLQYSRGVDILEGQQRLNKEPTEMIKEPKRLRVANCSAWAGCALLVCVNAWLVGIKERCSGFSVLFSGRTKSNSCK